MENNYIQNKFRWIYLTGIFLILALHILDLPPWFFPTDWGKSIVFRSIMAMLLFLFVFQLFYKKNELNLPDIRKNPIGKPWASNGAGIIIWILAGLFIVFLLASIFSVDPYFSFWGSPARAGGFINFAFYIIFAIFIFFIVKKSDWGKIWDFSIFIGIIVSVLAIIQEHGLFNKIFLLVASQPPSTIGNSVMLATYLLLLFFMTLPLALKEKRLPYKLFYAFCLALFLYVIIITESRAAYLGLLVGVLYFFLSYPTKKTYGESARGRQIKFIRIGIILVLIAVVGIVYYTNVNGQFPKFLKQNKLFQIIEPRLSIKLFLNDPRFSAWGVGLKALGEKPILGWGPENFEIAFDKFYDPSIPYLGGGGWWDRVHNAFLETAVTAGIPALLIYLTLFAVLFWQLHRIKRRTEHRETQIITNGIQAAVVGYLVAVFFSFDNVSTYLLFFLLIAYVLSLTSPDNKISENQLSSAKISGKTPLNQISKYKTPIIIILFILLVLFLWQYNFLPLQNSILLNEANSFVNEQKCDQSFALMDKAIKNRSFLDSYSRLKYVEFMKTCAGVHPENNLAYAEKGAELLKEAVKVQPLYTRSWIFLGAFTNIIADNEQDPATKQLLINEANSYFKEAFKLSPKRQEILFEQAKVDIVTGDYQAMKQKAEKCISLNPERSECYWIRALSEIYLKEDDKAKKDIEIAAVKGFRTSLFLTQLMDAYISPQQFNQDLATGNYQELVPIYQNLINLVPGNFQYHASLAYVYSKIGEYQGARREALIYWKMGGAKDEVKAFLSTLPKEFSAMPDNPPQ